MNVGELREALGAYADDVDVQIGYEGTHGPFVEVDEYLEGYENPHWANVPNKEDPTIASKRYLVQPNTIVLRTY